MLSIDSPSEKFLRMDQPLLFEALVAIRSGLPTSRIPPSPAPGLFDAAVHSPLPSRRHVCPLDHSSDSGELASREKNRTLSDLVMIRLFCPGMGCRWLETIGEPGQRVKLGQAW